MDIAGSLYPTGRIGTTNYILTPENIVNDMINMLPDDFWTPDIKVLDIFSKSGRFLMAAYKKLFNSPYLADMDIAKRKHHILNEQLYGITDDFTCLMLAESSLYGYAQYGKKNIRMIEDLQSIVKTTDKKLVAERLGKELGGQMEFDLVIGNPPYNKGADIDFVFLGCELSSKYVCMITPAKWQTAEANQRIVSKMSYGEFRQQLVPHMRYVCFYPNCSDVFLISQDDGISWYLLDKEFIGDCTVENKCKHQQYFNNVRSRDISNGETLNNIGAEIVKHLRKINTTIYKQQYRLYNKKYSVVANNKYNIERGIEGQYQAYGMISYKTGKMSVVCNPRVISTKDKEAELTTADSIVYESDRKEECESFISWVNTKMVRFLVSLNISRISPVFCDYAWRFVPAPPSGKFDHIYTDEELYKEFNLPQKYIDVIESVIKERK